MMAGQKGTNHMRKLIEHTYGNHVFMRLEIDGLIYEIDNYAGQDHSWKHYKTTADSIPAMRDRVIAAFNKLY